MTSQQNILPDKASEHWMDDFHQLNELSLTRSTTLFELEDTEVIKCAFAFKCFVDGIVFSKYQLSSMIGMDETIVFIAQGSQTTIYQTYVSAI